MDKDIFVNNRHTTYLKAKSWKTFKVADELYSQHKEADHKIVSQTVFESEKGNKTLVVADDSDIFILLLWATSSFKSDVFFRQGKSSDKKEIPCTEIYPLAEQQGEDVCEVLPAFHVLTGSDYTSSFFGKTKYTCFKRMIAHPESCSLLKSLNHPNANIGEVIEFVLRIIYNCPKSEKTLGDARHNMLFIKSKDKKKFASTKCLPPHEISLALKIKRDNYITISYTSCLNPIFVPPPATDYGWEDENGHLSPIWTEGPPIPLLREHTQDVPITFIADEDTEIVESNDGEDSENDDEDASTDVSDNDDSDWEL